MKLKDQVINLELAKKLKELGVKQDSLFYWTKRINFDWVIAYKYWRPHASELVYFDEHSEMCTKENLTRCISAFTVAELGELLPKVRFSHYGASKDISDDDIEKDFYELVAKYSNVPPKKWDIFYQSFDDGVRLDRTQSADNEANARAKMLIYLIENKHYE